jgi:ABC-type glycerol-3-phosphate transport system permease component
MIYNTGDAVFQYWNTKVDAGKTVVGQYTNFVNRYYDDINTPPWNVHWQNIKTVNFRNYIATTSINSWFRNTNFSTLNTANLNLNIITNAAYAFQGSKYNGSPLVLPNVVYLVGAYGNCSYLTG